MMRTLFLLLFCPVAAFGQVEQLYPINTIKFCVTSLLPYPAIQPSFEFGINRNWSIQAEVGYGILVPGKISDTVHQKSSGLKANLELRYYFGQHRSRFYFGLNAFYRYQRTNTLVNYIPAFDTSQILKDVFLTKKNIYGIAPMIGFQMIKGHFVVNPYIGGGILYRTNVNQFREYAPLNGDKYYMYNRHALWEQENIYGKLKENSGLAGYFTVGVRLGYGYKKKS